MNRLMIIGRVTRDPELRATKDGTQVCTFRMAVNKKAKDVERTTFFKVTAWRSLAEICAKYLAKGRQVSVIGEVDVSTYTGRDGIVHAELEVTAIEMELLGSREPAAPPAPAAPAKHPNSDGYIEIGPGEDLPF